MSEKYGGNVQQGAKKTLGEHAGVMRTPKEQAVEQHKSRFGKLYTFYCIQSTVVYYALCS